MGQGMYPNIYGDEKRMAGSYAKEVGGSRHNGEQAFNNQTFYSRMLGRRDQEAGYGQSLSNLAMLAMFLRRQRGQQGLDGGFGQEPMPQQQGQYTQDPSFGFLGPQYSAPSQGYVSPVRPYHEPEY